MIHKGLFGEGKHVMGMAYKGMTTLGGDTWGRCLGIVMAMIMLAGTDSLRAQVVSGSINGHDYADLGLSVKWATCNVGAANPWNYGSHFAWGEIASKKNFTNENCKTLDKRFRDIAGNAFYDAPRARWGGSWRMPTKAEAEELVNRCIWTWTTYRGNNGYKVTGPIGNSIFLPAAGSFYYESLNYVGGWGGYWTSTPYEEYDTHSYAFYFYSSYDFAPYHGMEWFPRASGYSIRPVTR